MNLEPELLDLLRAAPGLRLAVVFGSTARGEADPGDLDLGLLFERDVRPGLAFEGRLAKAAERQLDLVFLDTAPPLLRFEIARDGQVVHAADDEVWVDFKSRAMSDWWDFAPQVELFHRIAEERRALERSLGPG